MSLVISCSYEPSPLDENNCATKVEAAVLELDRIGRNFRDSYTGTISMLYEEDELWHQTYLQEVKPATGRILSVVQDLYSFAQQCSDDAAGLFHHVTHDSHGEGFNSHVTKAATHEGSHPDGIPLVVFQSTATIIAAFGRACRSYSLHAADNGHNYPGCMQVHPFCPPRKRQQYHRERVAITLADAVDPVAALVDMARASPAALECFADVDVAVWGALTLTAPTVCLQQACEHQVHHHTTVVEPNQLDDVARLMWACGVSNFHHPRFFHTVVLGLMDGFKQDALMVDHAPSTSESLHGNCSGRSVVSRIVCRTDPLHSYCVGDDGMDDGVRLGIGPGTMSADSNGHASASDDKDGTTSGTVMVP